MTTKPHALPLAKSQLSLKCPSPEVSTFYIFTIFGDANSNF